MGSMSDITIGTRLGSENPEEPDAVLLSIVQGSFQFVAFYTAPDAARLGEALLDAANDVLAAQPEAQNLARKLHEVMRNGDHLQEDPLSEAQEDASKRQRAQWVCVAVDHDKLTCTQAHPKDADKWCEPCKRRVIRISEILMEEAPENYVSRTGDYHRDRLDDEGIPTMTGEE